ncbi:hypothetical protein K437DRAFT_104648 [Tilletiaria anomala UBC 951]|uniref:Uncharacterized protein n=1 Tax=Tilletiaria anomala (strain ATCC 24038 / CBS 436.72 / UBC 951) TaxID=1037660 RepID=A0A066W7R7_TILAU|nr:uncharacterized protein K437DRAFT_104648 [Tilletiaria anomala UBC 951]KDN46805.1 hypothetical protein K437DRAFT_104648 [Tilletiaria anomala UBC 951]
MKQEQPDKVILGGCLFASCDGIDQPTNIFLPLPTATSPFPPIRMTVPTTSGQDREIQPPEKSAVASLGEPSSRCSVASLPLLHLYPVPALPSRCFTHNDNRCQSRSVAPGSTVSLAIHQDSRDGGRAASPRLSL